AVVAASVSFAHAGGGGFGTPIDTFALDCYLVNGANPPQVVALDDQFFPGEAQRTNVPLGKAKMLCTPAVVTIKPPQTPQAIGIFADHLMCYEAPPSSPAPRVLKQVVDSFQTQVVEIGAPRFTCVGAFKCDVGTSCPGQ